MKETTKKVLDFVPIVLLIVYSAVEWTGVPGIVIKWQTYLGFGLLLLTLIAFMLKHQIGILLTLILIILGFLGLISLTPAIFTGGSLNIGNIQMPLGEPSFFLLLIIHFIFSSRHYTGILRRNYLKNCMAGKKDSNGQ